MASSESYVYVYRDEKGRPLYIGKGTGRRDTMHRYQAASGSQAYWHNKMRKMDRLGEKYTVERIEEGMTNDQACELEEFLIAECGRKNIDPGGVLYNLLEGGDGASPDDMRRMYESEDFRRKQREGAQRNAKNPEWLAKVVEGSKRAMARPETAESLAEAREIRWSAEGASEHHSKSMAEWYSDPENKERQAQALRDKRANDPEYDRRQREGIKKKWEDPEFRARSAEGKAKSWEKEGNEERRKLISEIMKKKWQDPEFIANRAAAMKKVMMSRRAAKGAK